MEFRSCKPRTPKITGDNRKAQNRFPTRACVREWPSVHLDCRRLAFRQRRQWHPTPVLLPGKSHGRRKNPHMLCVLSFLIQFSSVAQSCLTLCDPMNRSTPGLPVHHQLLEFTQTHVHLVGDAIQPSHPLSSLSPPAPNPSQHQSLFQ